MSWIIFDDIFFIYDPDQSLFSSHPIVFLPENLRQSDAKKINLVVDTPFQLVPEMFFEETSKGILMQAVHPFTHFQNDQIRVDTWSNQYVRCVYYLPHALYHLNSIQQLHWMTAVERFSKGFFDQVTTALVCLRIYDTLYILIQVGNLLKEALRLQVPSPDDSTYHLLKCVEKYKSHQSEFVLFTNEKEPAHLRILKKYVREVRLLNGDKDHLIREIIQGI